MKENSSGAAPSASRQVLVDGPSNSSVEKKLSATALSQQSPLRLMLWRAPAAASKSRKLRAANSTPRSEWKMNPGGGRLRANARRSASLDSSASRLPPTDQPTTFRE